MPVQVVACLSANPDAPEAQQEYYASTLPLMEAAGGRVVQRHSLGKVVMGQPVAETLLVVEYPDLDAMAQVFNSPAYRAIIPVRDKAFNTYSVSVLNED